MSAAAPHPSVDASATRSDVELRTQDGVRLAGLRWSPASGKILGRVLVLPGYAEHAERYREVALALAERGLESLVLDFRGHGGSDGQRGYVEAFIEYHRDVSAALAALGPEPHFILGHSTGALIALDYVATHKPTLAGLVVTNPYLELGIPVPALKRAFGRLAGRLAPRLALPSGLPPEWMTRDTAIVDEYRRDPRIFKTVTAGWFRETTTAQARVRALGGLPVPLLYVYSEQDRIALPAANRDLAAQLTVADKRVVVREDDRHEVLNELQRVELFGVIGDWLIKHAS